MPENHEMDILTEVADENLTELAEIYKQLDNWAPQVFNTICMGIRWKESSKYKNLITFLSPNDSWRNDGTIIILMEVNKFCDAYFCFVNTNWFQYSCYQLFLFTLDENCSNLYEGLMKTKKIDFNKEVLIYNLFEKQAPAILKFIEQRNLKITDTCRSVIYIKSPQEARNIKFDCPSEVHIRKLDTTMSSMINSVWPHRYPTSENFVSALIEMNGGYGIFLKSTGELVSWIIKHCLAGLGMIQTLDQYKGKGYGSLVTNVMTKHIGEDNQWTYATVMEDNKASNAMFKKLNFGEAGFIRNFSVISREKNV